MYPRLRRQMGPLAWDRATARVTVFAVFLPLALLGGDVSVIADDCFQLGTEVTCCSTIAPADPIWTVDLGACPPCTHPIHANGNSLPLVGVAAGHTADSFGKTTNWCLLKEYECTPHGPVPCAWTGNIIQAKKCTSHLLRFENTPCDREEGGT